MMCGSFSGQPVENARTKSACVDRSAISQTPKCLRRRHEGGDFDLDFCATVNKTVDIEQRRGWEVAPQSRLPARTNPRACRLVLAAACQVPGQPHDVLGAGAGFAQQLDDPLQG